MSGRTNRWWFDARVCRPCRCRRQSTCSWMPGNDYCPRFSCWQSVVGNKTRRENSIWVLEGTNFVNFCNFCSWKCHISTIWGLPECGLRWKSWVSFRPTWKRRWKRRQIWQFMLCWHVLRVDISHVLSADLPDTSTGHKHNTQIFWLELTSMMKETTLIWVCFETKMWMIKIQDPTCTVTFVRICSARRKSRNMMATRPPNTLTNHEEIRNFGICTHLQLALKACNMWTAISFCLELAPFVLFVWYELMQQLTQEQALALREEAENADSTSHVLRTLQPLQWASTGFGRWKGCWLFLLTSFDECCMRNGAVLRLQLWLAEGHRRDLLQDATFVSELSNGWGMKVWSPVIAQHISGSSRFSTLQTESVALSISIAALG